MILTPLIMKSYPILCYLVNGKIVGVLVLTWIMVRHTYRILDLIIDGKILHKEKLNVGSSTRGVEESQTTFKVLQVVFSGDGNRHNHSFASLMWCFDLPIFLCFICFCYSLSFATSIPLLFFSSLLSCCNNMVFVPNQLLGPNFLFYFPRKLRPTLLNNYILTPCISTNFFEMNKRNNI